MARAKMVEVAAGVHALGTERFNWYVVEQGGRFTVVDSGLPKHWLQLGALLGRLGAGLGDVEAVLLTHAHPDHAGTAERTREAAEATVYAHEREWDAARSGKPPALRVSQLKDMWRPSYLSYVWEMVRAGASSFPPIAELSALEDGATLDVPGRPRVVAVPGHTLGSCALHLPDAGVVFTGDALVTFNAAHPGRTGPQLMGRAWLEDPEQALASLDRLEALDAHTVLPGHGPPWTGGAAEAARRARATAQAGR